jgi:pumilio RNA-binding family
LQYVVAHGAPVEGSAIVNRFIGHVVSMSYQRFASNVIEKCLMVGSFQDRQLIATEIFSAGGFDHLRVGDLSIYIYIYLVISAKLVTHAFFFQKQ